MFVSLASDILHEIDPFLFLDLELNKLSMYSNGSVNLRA